MCRLARSPKRNKRKVVSGSRVTIPYLKILLGTTRLPGTTLFWLQKAKYDHNTDKISALQPRKHQVLLQFAYFCFGNKLFSSFVICSCVGLQGHRSVTNVKLSRAVGLPYQNILLINPGYLLTLLLGLPW